MENELYSNDEMCMRFSSDEIYEYFVNSINEFIESEVRIIFDDDGKVDEEGNKLISDVVMDGYKEDYNIAFYGYRTSLYFFNEEFVFFDDSIRDRQRYAEAFNNVVYEGSLRDKTHKYTLSMFVEIYKILLDVDKVEIEFEPTGESHTHYEIYNYTILCKSKSGQKFEKRFSNILFIVE